jgi:hypothetical protein
VLSFRQIGGVAPHAKRTYVEARAPDNRLPSRVPTIEKTALEENVRGQLRIAGTVNTGSNKRKRAFVPGDGGLMESRVLMSSMIRSLRPVPAALVATSPQLRETTAHKSKFPTAPLYAPASALENGVPRSEHPNRRPVGSAARVANHRSDPAAAVAPTVKRWSWLAGTYWYVPPMNLPAVLYNSSTGALIPVRDQTVFQITGYRAGYFWGKAVTQLGPLSPSTSTMIGSVTPEGKVLLTFTTTSTNSSPSITEGFGIMTRKFKQWTMENQMFTSPSDTSQIGHWAYMLQTRLGMRSWKSLPSAGVSVPTFLSE